MLSALLGFHVTSSWRRLRGLLLIIFLTEYHQLSGNTRLIT
jgi:hypothetical protein